MDKSRDFRRPSYGKAISGFIWVFRFNFVGPYHFAVDIWIEFSESAPNNRKGVVYKRIAHI